MIEFGGDGKTFSEDNHISEMREAMDKISGVTPIAAGGLRPDRPLTNAAALRVTMLAPLAKTERNLRPTAQRSSRCASWRWRGSTARFVPHDAG